MKERFFFHVAASVPHAALAEDEIEYYPRKDDLVLAEKRQQGNIFD